MLSGCIYIYPIIHQLVSAVQLCPLSQREPFNCELFSSTSMLFIMLYKLLLTMNLCTKSYSVAIQIAWKIFCLIFP